MGLIPLMQQGNKNSSIDLFGKRQERDLKTLQRQKLYALIYSLGSAFTHLQQSQRQGMNRLKPGQAGWVCHGLATGILRAERTQVVYFDLWQLTRSRKVKENTSPCQVHLNSVPYRNRPRPTYFHQFGTRRFPRPRGHLNFNHLPSVQWNREQEQHAPDILIHRVPESLCQLPRALVHKLRQFEETNEPAWRTLAISSLPYNLNHLAGA